MVYQQPFSAAVHISGIQVPGYNVQFRLLDIQITEQLFWFMVAERVSVPWHSGKIALSFQVQGYSQVHSGV